MHTSCESFEHQKAVYACARWVPECHDRPKKDQNPFFQKKISKKKKFPKGKIFFFFFSKKKKIPKKHSQSFLATQFMKNRKKNFRSVNIYFVFHLFF